MLQTTKKPLLVHLSSEHISQTKAESVWPFKCKPMIFLFDLALVRTRIQLLLVFIYPGILHFVSWLHRVVPKALRGTHRTGQGQGLGAVAAPQCHRPLEKKWHYKLTNNKPFIQQAESLEKYFSIFIGSLSLSVPAVPALMEHHLSDKPCSSQKEGSVEVGNYTAVQQDAAFTTSCKTQTGSDLFNCSHPKMLFLQGAYKCLPKVTWSLNVPNSAVLSIQEEFMLCHKFMLPNFKLI